MEGDPSIRFENYIACSLLKEIQRLFDTEGIKSRLYFIQTKTGREIDFLIELETKDHWLIESKWKDSHFSPNFSYFFRHFKKAKCIQLVKLASREKTTLEGWISTKASRWLSQFSLTD